MHFVYGHGEVADCPEDDDAHVLYKSVAFFDGRHERVGQIVRWGRSENSLYLGGMDEHGAINDVYVKWVPIFQRFEAVKTN